MPQRADSHGPGLEPADSVDSGAMFGGTPRHGGLSTSPANVAGGFSRLAGIGGGAAVSTGEDDRLTGHPGQAVLCLAAANGLLFSGGADAAIKVGSVLVACIALRLLSIPDLLHAVAPSAAMGAQLDPLLSCHTLLWPAPCGPWRRCGPWLAPGVWPRWRATGGPSAGWRLWEAIWCQVGAAGGWLSGGLGWEGATLGLLLRACLLAGDVLAAPHAHSFAP